MRTNYRKWQYEAVAKVWDTLDYWDRVEILQMFPEDMDDRELMNSLMDYMIAKYNIDI